MLEEKQLQRRRDELRGEEETPVESRGCSLTDEGYVIGWKHFESLCARVCAYVCLCCTWMCAEPPVSSQMCLQLLLLLQIGAIKVVREHRTLHIMERQQ